MRVELIRIGNSLGIQIPKLLIKQCGFGNTVDLRVEHGCLIIAPDRPPRQGWRKVSEAAEKAPKDQLLDAVVPNNFDSEEWQW